MNNQTNRRTVMIFPQFKNINIIQKIRKKYDPLFQHVSPHITLTFTFKSNFTHDAVKEHLEEILNEVKPFRLTMDKVVKIDNALGRYLFLVPKEGADIIKSLNSRLYTGILEPYKPEWLNEKTFMPHMTIGTFNSKDELDKAYEEASQSIDKETFATMVNKVSCEIIADNEDSIIDIEVNLKSNI